MTITSPLELSVSNRGVQRVARKRLISLNYWNVAAVVKNLTWCACIRSEDSYLWSWTKEGKSGWTALMCPFGIRWIWADIFRGVGSWAHLCQQVSGKVLWQGCFPPTCSIASIPRYSYQQDVVLCRGWSVSYIISSLEFERSTKKKQIGSSTRFYSHNLGQPRTRSDLSGH